MQPYPRSLDLFMPGHPHGTGCLSIQAMDTELHTVVCRLCFGLGFAVAPPILAGVQGVCLSVRASASPHKSWLRFVVRVFGLLFFLHPANPGWGVVTTGSSSSRDLTAPPRPHLSRHPETSTPHHPAP